MVWEYLQPLIVYVHFVMGLKNLPLHQEVLLKIIFADVIQLMAKIALGVEKHVIMMRR
jgi:hypothetical protein